jgi:hypothetical protein
MLKEITDEATDFYKKLELDVLARTLWGEARDNSEEMQEAVVNVVMNRLAISKERQRYWWGNDIISICQKPYQFECWNRALPLYRKISNVNLDDSRFLGCIEIALEGIDEVLFDNTKKATHYHHESISPYWSKGETPTVTIEGCLFYQLVGIKP